MGTGERGRLARLPMTVLAGFAGRSVVASAPAPTTICLTGPAAHPPTDRPRSRTTVKSAVETLTPTRVRLTVEVPFDELKPSVDAAYRKMTKQVRIQGFRPGKVPPRIIDQRIGRGAVIEEAVQAAIPRFYGDAVRDTEVSPLGHPEVDVTTFDDGVELVFTAEVDVRPKVELPAYDGLPV